MTVLLHFISMFRGVLIGLALVSIAMEAINLTILGLMVFPAMPVASSLVNTLGIGMPAAIQ